MLAESLFPAVDELVLLSFILDIRKLLLGDLILLVQVVPLFLELFHCLLLLFPLSLKILKQPLVLVLSLCQLPVLAYALILQFVDLVVVLLPLGLKEFKLLFEGLVPSGLHHFKSATGVLVLLFESFNHLPLHGQFMLDLSRLLAVSLLKFS